MAQNRRYSPEIALIICIAAGTYGSSLHEVITPAKKSTIPQSQAKQLASYLIRKYTRLRCCDCAPLLGHKGHSQTAKSAALINDLKDLDPRIKQDVTTLERALSILNYQPIERKIISK